MAVTREEQEKVEKIRAERDLKTEPTPEQKEQHKKVQDAQLEVQRTLTRQARVLVNDLSRLWSTMQHFHRHASPCLLYTSPSPRD